MDKKVKRVRKPSDFLVNFKKEIQENPIVEHLPNDPITKVTTKQHVIKLQELLVQTCIDYINENELTDIYSVSFNADSLNESAKYGSWQPCTDSYIKVKGITNENYKTKNGEIIKMPSTYLIDEYY